MFVAIQSIRICEFKTVMPLLVFICLVFNNLEAFLLQLAILTLIPTLDFCFGFYHTTLL
ncbi:42577_t:CDS:1, partial [Gigaspora margarita]